MTAATHKTQTPQVLAILTLALTLLAIPVMGRLLQENQDIRQQASTKKPACKEECPSTKDGVLRNCTPPDSDGGSQDSLCNAKGRVETCGGKSYCCPSAGGKWNPDMAPCATPTPKPPACKDDKDCPKGQACIQPPMPTCAPGKDCAQVLPPKKCAPISPTPTLKPGACKDDTDCKAGQICVQPPMPTCPAGRDCIQVMPPKKCVAGTYAKADINQDGFVDNADLTILLANYHLSPPTHVRADINDDGEVNALDYARLIDAYAERRPD